MIPNQYINEWREHAPWNEDAMVEQDLVISRALIEIFNNKHLSNALAFRGGTALHKLFFKPAARYSEDIDLVQIKSEPIGETFDALRHVLDPWLGKPQRKLKEGRANLYYRYPLESNNAINMRLKIEINTREHFSVMNYQSIPFSIENPWFSGSANINSYHFSELMATKLRALYQRKKGRDLFDLWLALKNKNFNTDEILHCFEKYMSSEETKISRAEFEMNLFHKLQDLNFINDIKPLLAPTELWEAQEAYKAVHTQLICHLPGAPWNGEKIKDSLRPASIQSFKGMKDFPDTKTLRDGLKAPKEDPLK